ncbi:hypothetical protein [Curtobacterium sp. MCSS17_016]|uniref:hypothetical protein n=1 Tax=Curtobacterium sp. MCSS17_016 TaxID=2175644 RepID=UPI000DA95117|nr:hypothetical protein [Curtobacterium sp. MCSS17_016]WIE81343.1 hypothetical protein DEJ19_019100 [Curtobacterium sp. MCSS17_016]
MHGEGFEQFRETFANEDGRRRLGWFLNDDTAAAVLADDGRLRTFYESWHAEHGDGLALPDPAAQRKAMLGGGFLLLIIGLFVFIAASGAAAAHTTTVSDGPCRPKPYFDSAIHCPTTSTPNHDAGWGILVGGAVLGGASALTGLVMMARHPLLRP